MIATSWLSSSVQCCHDCDIYPVIPGLGSSRPGTDWCTDKWQHRCQGEHLYTDHRWSLEITRDIGGPLVYLRCSADNCLMQTSPKWHVPEREVSSYHLIILSFVPIIEFKRYISTIQCLVWSYQDSVTCYSWDDDILGTTAAVIPAGDKSCLITS